LRAWAERNRRAYSTEVEITMEPYLEREEALQARLIGEQLLAFVSH
jgi:hypothetical protein